MKVFFDLPDGFYAIKNNELYSVDLPIAKFDNAKSVKISALEIQSTSAKPISCDIQHVGYDSDQCGRDK